MQAASMQQSVDFWSMHASVCGHIHKWWPVAGGALWAPDRGGDGGRVRYRSVCLSTYRSTFVLSIYLPTYLSICKSLDTYPRGCFDYILIYSYIYLSVYIHTYMLSCACVHTGSVCFPSHRNLHRLNCFALICR